MKISTCKYKDIEAIACHTPSLSALFTPHYGAKLLSLKHIDSARELLEQAPGENYKVPEYDGVYVDGECSAFDDMFPTIDRDYCMDFPWEGSMLCDHGEVWALEWQHEIVDDKLHMWVYSPRFAYRLDKWVSQQSHALMIRYCVRNLSCFDFNFLYAAHCMLAALHGGVLELPYPDHAPCTTIFSTSGTLGSYGDKVSWKNWNGTDLAYSYPETTKDGFKIYFDDCIPEGWCRYHLDDQTALEITFDQVALPYFGLWVNWCAFQNKYNVAIEPCSAPMDSPNKAKAHSKHSVLKAGQCYEWFISFDSISATK